ncbi:Glutaredoxin 4 [Nymphon striatum]|nr:Glutaredoxin 4 [Nymphon striatum]
MVGSFDQDLKNNRSLEALVGVEYQDCCWKTRLVVKPRVRTYFSFIRHTERQIKTITSGEPSGIGPDLIIQLADSSFPAELIAKPLPEKMEEMDVMDRIKDAVEGNEVIVFMKGTPQLPQCGFSSRTAQALMGCGEEFAYVNVLTDPEIFQNLPRYADWPTFPQVYINGELIGGCDITLEMFEKGELQTMIKEAKAGSKEA